MEIRHYKKKQYDMYPPGPFYIRSNILLEMRMCNRNMQEFALYTYEEYESTPAIIHPRPPGLILTS